LLLFRHGHDEEILKCEAIDGSNSILCRSRPSASCLPHRPAFGSVSRSLQNGWSKPAGLRTLIVIKARRQASKAAAPLYRVVSGGPTTFQELKKSMATSGHSWLN